MGYYRDNAEGVGRYYDEEADVDLQCSEFRTYEDFKEAIDQADDLSDEGWDEWVEEVAGDIRTEDGFTAEALVDAMPDNAEEVLRWLQYSTGGSWPPALGVCESDFSITLWQDAPPLDDGWAFEAVIPCGSWDDPDAWHGVIAEISGDVLPACLAIHAAYNEIPEAISMLERIVDSQPDFTPEDYTYYLESADAGVPIEDIFADNATFRSVFNSAV